MRFGMWLMCLGLAACSFDGAPDKYIFADEAEKDTTPGQDTRRGLDTRRGQDTLPGVDTAHPGDVNGPDVPPPPSTCEEYWNCVIDKGCSLAQTDGSCMNQCTNGDTGPEAQKFNKLRECAVDKCSTNPTGDSVTACTWQHCSPDWYACVMHGGNESCGDMFQCLQDFCKAKDYPADCVSNCIRNGTDEAYQQLAALVSCGQLFDWALNPMGCVEKLVTCYAGSGEEHRGCGETLACQVDCHWQHCPVLLDLSQPNCDADALWDCAVGCLHGLALPDKEPMTRIQQCILENAHNKLEKDDVNMYEHCLLTSNECLMAVPGTFGKCKDTMNCMEDVYNYFVPSTDISRQFIKAADCMMDLNDNERQDLQDAIICLVSKFMDFQGVSWMEGKQIWQNCNETFCK